MEQNSHSSAPLTTTFHDIEEAAARIKGAVYEPPCPQSIPLSELTGMKIHCKLDNLQRTGSFKERGARNALVQLSAEQKKIGVIAASAGNHAQALAYQGRLLGVPATVVMPKFAPLIKITNCQKLGATVVLQGRDFAEAKARAHEIAAEQGLAYIDGYDDPAIIAGQGTAGPRDCRAGAGSRRGHRAGGRWRFARGRFARSENFASTSEDHRGRSRPRRQFFRGAPRQENRP